MCQIYYIRKFKALPLAQFNVFHTLQKISRYINMDSYKQFRGIVSCKSRKTFHLDLRMYLCIIVRYNFTWLGIHFMQ